MKTYDQAKRILQLQCVTCGGYDLESLGITSVGGFWYKYGKRMSGEEVDAVIDGIPIDEVAIRKEMAN